MPGKHYKNIKIFTSIIICILILTNSKVYAKYMSTISITKNVRVAKWEWTINSNKVFSNDYIIYYDYDTETTNNLCNIDSIICNEINISIKNDSEVEGKYFLEIISNDINIMYSYDKENWLSIDEISKLMVKQVNINSEDNLKIYWKCNNNQQNEIKLKVYIKLYQVD